MTPTPRNGFLSGATFAILGRLLLFVITVGALGWLSNTEIARRTVVKPVTRFSVVVSHLVINLFGGAAQREGTILIGPVMPLDIKDGCNGIIAMILFAGAVVAHEAAIKSKLLGLAVGIPIIWAVNLVRIITLYVVSVVAPARVEFFHIYFWQTLIIICVVVIWYVWASRSSGGPGSTSPRPPANDR